MAQEMKDSGIEWIGKIPANWNAVALKRLCSMQAGKNLVAEQILDEGIYPVYGGNGLRGFFSDYNADGEYLLIGRQGALCGNVHYINGQFWATEHAVITKSTLMADTEFLYFLLIGMNLSQYASNTAAQPGLSVSEIQNVQTCVPPVPTQHRIAAFLDRKCAEIDSVIADTQKTIEEYKALKQSIITEAVTKGVRGERKMKDSGVEWIGDVPEEWEVIPVKYVAEFQPSCDMSNLTDDSIITYLPMEHLKNGYYIQNTAFYGSVASSLTPFMNGDIVMAKVTPCFENGNIAIMNDLSSGVGMGSSELFVYRPLDVQTKYLLYWLQNILFKQAACATMTGTGGLKRVSPYFAKHSKMTLPCYKEQLEIIRYLDEKCTSLDKLIESKQQLLTELESYKKSVIYEYVTGKKEVL